jgi:folate-binding protein YgfZ
MPDPPTKRMNHYGIVANGYNDVTMMIPSYDTITVSGDDAFEFLQNQLAADLRDIPATPPTLAAWCNPKGRVICLLRVTPCPEGYALSLPAELSKPVAQRLSMFRFRSRVQFTAATASAAELGVDSSLDEWRLQNLRDGIVEITASESEKFTPHMLNLDLLGAVSLDKGCYPGQEIVARTHYRGATKRRCKRFDSDGAVTAGDKVSDGVRDVGEVVNAIGNELLAVVPVELDDTTLSANGIGLRPLELPYDTG